MSWIETIIIAIVEGLTEFFPVSSTGHMIITENLLGIKPDKFVKAFTVIIQFGAILSVVVLYFRRFFQSVDFYWKLLIAFSPSCIFGFLFSDKIDAMLGSVTVIIFMLIAGGIFMLFVDKLFVKTTDIQAITLHKAFFVGLCQCVAMIPGVSRSMATIVGGMFQKLTREHAIEFSFFLAVPTMFAASIYELFDLFLKSESRQLLIDNWNVLLVGNVIAFIVAVIAIKLVISFFCKYGFKVFGWYRIVIGIILLGMLSDGYNLQLH